jgi:hypothetical protein
MTAAQLLVEVAQRINASAKALGEAIDSVAVYTEPAVARAVQAERNLYDRIDAEYGLLTAAEAGRRMGSRSTAPRNLALLGISRGHQTLYPGFQFGADGQPLPVIRTLRELAQRVGWSESSAVQWLCAPTTYLDGRRPAELLAADPDRVLDVAQRAWAVEW